MKHLSDSAVLQRCFDGMSSAEFASASFILLSSSCTRAVVNILAQSHFQDAFPGSDAYTLNSNFTPAAIALVALYFGTHHGASRSMVFASLAAASASVLAFVAAQYSEMYRSLAFDCPGVFLPFTTSYECSLLRGAQCTASLEH